MYVDDGEECQQLVFRESRNDFPQHSGQPDFTKGVGLYNFLSIEPAPERSDGAQVAVDGMARETPFLRSAEGVVGEAPLLLQVEDEGPDLSDADVDRVGR